MLARLVASSEVVPTAMRGPVSSETMAPVNQLLQRYKQKSNSLRLALFSADGTLLASDQESSEYIGQDFSFRPYVKQALGGSESHYFAYGVTDNLPGYYASVPVPSADGNGAFNGLLPSTNTRICFSSVPMG